MLNRLHFFYNKHWFLFGLGLKFVLLVGFIFADYYNQSHLFSGIAKPGSDYSEQLNTIDNLVDHGVLSMDGVSPYAGRTPGFIFPYYFIRLLFSKTIAWQFQILFQILFNVLAARCMYKLVWRYTNNKRVSLFAFISVCVVTYVSWIDFELSPESLAISSYVMGLFYFNEHINKNKISYLWLSGLLMGWSFFLRGFTIPYSLIFVLLHTVQKNNPIANSLCSRCRL